MKSKKRISKAKRKRKLRDSFEFLCKDYLIKVLGREVVEKIK